MSSLLIQDLIDAGVHYGHRASRWNPKMRPYIFGKRGKIHVINVRETVRGLLRARKYLQQVVTDDRNLVLFVGTKRQASETIMYQGGRCGMPFVGERWLGGTLTNFKTIHDRLKRLVELETLRASEEFTMYSKKMQSSLNREYRKMYRNLNGLRTLDRIPEVLVIVDPKKEKNAVKEAQKMGVTTIALIDTNSDPDEIDLPIPGNDDSIRSIELIIGYLADSVLLGKGKSIEQGKREKSEAVTVKSDVAVDEEE